MLKLRLRGLPKDSTNLLSSVYRFKVVVYNNIVVRGKGRLILKSNTYYEYSKLFEGRARGKARAKPTKPRHP